MDRIKTAVVLFNLGGPDTQKAVLPFLFNLFRDKAIISAPAFVRYPLAGFIATTRAKSARSNYQLMGGGSPILPQTKAQAEALETQLNRALPERAFKCFVAMRYWHPFVEDTVRDVEEWAPDQVVLLPLYPQFSSTTSGSSLESWQKHFSTQTETRTICCYPELEGLARSHAQAIRAVLDAKAGGEKIRVLFSAHGLPEKIVASGDPYVEQIHATVQSVLKGLEPDLDYRVCFQSRVGPLKWVGPSTVEEISRAGADKVSIIVCPIAFVSEHIETLVELDIEYRELAEEVGCPGYDRTPTPGVGSSFIEGLADLVLGSLSGPKGLCGTSFRCSGLHRKCPRLAA